MATELISQTADFLATVPLFSGLQRDEIQKFADLTRERAYPKGSVILFQDDPGDSLFIVLSGGAALNSALKEKFLPAICRGEALTAMAPSSTEPKRRTVRRTAFTAGRILVPPMAG